MKVPLARQYYFGHVATALDQMNVGVEALLSRHHIPQWQYSHQDDAIPLFDFIRMFVIGSHAVGDERFGVSVAELNQLNNFGRYGTLIAKSNTVYNALNVVVDRAQQQVTSIRIWIQRTENGILICRKQLISDPDIQPALAHLEQYVMTELVGVVRLGAGSQWSPPHAWFSSAQEALPKRWHAFRNTTFHYDAAYSAFLVPNHVLHRPIGIHGQATPSVPGDPKAGDPAPIAELDFVATLRHLLQSLQCQKSANVETVREIFGISERTLRRRLTARGTSFRAIREQAQFVRASELLAEPDAEIADIADAVGYEYPQHFIRAFRRWAGVTPGQYRQCETDRLQGVYS
ncbi:MAG: helix-turn-helix domain-containing protein [Hyphomicrobiaceae bacterium]